MSYLSTSILISINGGVGMEYYIETDLPEANFVITIMEDMASIAIKIRDAKIPFYP